MQISVLSSSSRVRLFFRPRCSLTVLSLLVLLDCTTAKILKMSPANSFVSVMGPFSLIFCISLTVGTMAWHNVYCDFCMA